MLRARRYRVLLIFAAAFILAFVHFARSRDWSDAPIDLQSFPVAPAKPNSASDSTQDEVSDRFAPAKPDLNSFGSGPDAYVPPKFSITPLEDSKSSSGTKFSSSYSGSSYSGSSGSSSSGSSSYSSSDDIKDTSASTKSPASEEKNYKTTIPPSDEKQSPVSSDASLSLSDTDNAYYLLEEIDTGGTGRMSVNHQASGPTTRWQKFPERFPVSAAELIKLPKDHAKSMPKLQAKLKEETSAEKQERLQQLSRIRSEFKRSWLAYKKFAMGHDEIKPLTATFEDPFNGWGATLVDALDTLWIMDLKDEFAEAVDAVKKIDFKTSAREDIPVFETVIRYLGGLIGAYDISGQRYAELLGKAEELAEVLMGAFDTPNRMPVLYYRWTPDHVSRPHRASKTAGLAELGSLSLEFTRLAQLTKEDKYYDAIARITNQLERLQDDTTIPGLWPMRVNAQGCAKYRPTQQLSRAQSRISNEEQPRSVQEPLVEMPEAKNITTITTGSSRKHSAPLSDKENYMNLVSRDFSDIDLSESDPAPNRRVSAASDSEDKCDGDLLLPTAYRDNKYTMGGMADSTYEYLPKEYLLLGGASDQYKHMYKKAIDAARTNLLFRPMIKGQRDIRFMASTSSLDAMKKGADISDSLIYESHHLTCFVGGMVAVGAKAFGIEGDMELAAKLTDGCVWAYESTTTGIMPERFRVLPCEKGKSCEWDEASYEKEVKKFGHVRDSAAETQYRNGESTYGQRVKLNTDYKAPEVGDNGLAVPLPMPGALNPHDRDPGYVKRDSFAVGREAATSAVPKPASPTGAVDGLFNRDAPRGSSAGPLSQTDRDYHLPEGMVSIASAEYYLRPEAIESVFIMFRLTGDNTWRQKGWKMYEAISTYSRTDLANAAIADVMSQKPTQKDAMESFWLAETLKYFYLLFSDPDVVDLDKYVLNTEAHPFQRPI